MLLLKMDEFTAQAIYDFCWVLMRDRPELKGWTKPYLVQHPLGAWDAGNAWAAYCGDHVIMMGSAIWAGYGGHYMTYQDIQDMVNIFTHEICHIVHPHHEMSFYEMLSDFDQSGYQIREYRKAGLEKLKAMQKKVKPVKKIKVGDDYFMRLEEMKAKAAILKEKRNGM